MNYPFKSMYRIFFCEFYMALYASLFMGLSKCVTAVHKRGLLKHFNYIYYIIFTTWRQ